MLKTLNNKKTLTAYRLFDFERQAKPKVVILFWDFFAFADLAGIATGAHIAALQVSSNDIYLNGGVLNENI